jgi:hypothetical protein
MVAPVPALAPDAVVVEAGGCDVDRGAGAGAGAGAEARAGAVAGVGAAVEREGCAAWVVDV